MMFAQILGLLFMGPFILYAAESPKPLGSFHAWHLYQQSDGRCYIESSSYEGQKTQIIAGLYPDIPSPVVVSVALNPVPRKPLATVTSSGGTLLNTLELKSEKDRLWSQDVAMDKTLVSVMRKGWILDIRDDSTVSARFSLQGFTEALKELQRRCLKIPPAKGV